MGSTFKTITAAGAVGVMSACGGSSTGPGVPQLMLAPAEVRSGDVVLSNSGDGTMPVINGVTVDLSQGAVFSEANGLTYGQPLDKAFEYIVGTAGSLVGSTFVQQTAAIAAADGLSLSRGTATDIQVAGRATLNGHYSGFIRDANASFLATNGLSNASRVQGLAQVSVDLGEGTLSGQITDRTTDSFVTFLPNKQGGLLDDVTITGGMLTGNGEFTGTATGGAAQIASGRVTAFPGTVRAMVDRQSAAGAASDLVGVGTFEQRQTISLDQQDGPALEYATRETGVFVVQ